MPILNWRRRSLTRRAAYNKVRGNPDVGMTEEALAMQEATAGLQRRQRAPTCCKRARRPNLPPVPPPPSAWRRRS